MTIHETAAKRHQIITTNITCMCSLLETALKAVLVAEQAAEANEANQAIGCLLDIDSLLANAKALYDTTLFIHRNMQ